MNRKLKIKNECANYKDGICILKGYECPLVTPFEYRGKAFPCEEMECDYYNTIVDQQQKEVVGNTKKCKVCSKLFKSKANATKLCSDSCRKLSRRKTHRRYNKTR